MAEKFLIVSHVQHISKSGMYFGYAPYINEMNIWSKYFDEVIVLAPVINDDLNSIFSSYSADKLTLIAIPNFNLTNLKAILLSFFTIPIIVWKLIHAMKKADHIHLRCPGNIGLLGCIVQIFFPKKVKTAKYAGNWDPNAKQPFTYKLQRWILSNTFLTRNMKVLVYGEWENQTKNIKPFFTATYSESEIQNSEFSIQNIKNQELLHFLFVGTLSKGKQPLCAIQLVEALFKEGKKVTLDLYGSGVMKSEVEAYIRDNGLESIIRLKGNQSKETLSKAYQDSHFLILPSKSEGWPKAVAEAMFWGCVPIASPVSCVSYMMGNGSRGIVLTGELKEDANRLLQVMHNETLYNKMALEGQSWSRQFTTDRFEEEIRTLLNG